jgi:hypothetical protein
MKKLGDVDVPSFMTSTTIHPPDMVAEVMKVLMW